MGGVNGGYDQLVVKLDQFIRKYYVNQFIKGSLYTVAVVVGLFLVFNLLEHYFYFTSSIRKALFYSFCLVSISSIFYWVVQPLLKYSKLGSTISHEQAALIIGEHFADVKDKLVNILQLKKSEETQEHKDLVIASIEQKTKSIQLVPFQKAIDLSRNNKYLKYALPPFLLFITLLFTAPSIIYDSTQRLIQNDKEFARKAPFSFVLEEKKLEVVQFEDFTLDVYIEGDVLPNDVNVSIDGFQYQCEKVDNAHFKYVFKNVNKQTSFLLNAGTVSSVPYVLTVIKKPNLVKFNVVLEYPAYIGKKSEMLSSIGDFTVPEGTKCTWNFNAEETEDVLLQFEKSQQLQTANKKSPTEYAFAKKVVADEYYKVFLSNKKIPKPDSVLYAINVIKDQYPNVSVEQIIDSTDNSIIYFVGQASDDYGLTTLSFNYTITKPNGKVIKNESIKLQKQEGNEIQFSHILDLKKITLEPGEKISYYFEVMDNDGVNGRKSAKTNVMNYEKPTLEQIKEKEEINEEAIKDELKDALKKMDKLKDKIQKLRENLLQAKKMDWKDKKEMEKLLEEQKKLLEQIEKAKQKLDENKKTQEEYNTLPEELQQKQDKLEDLFEKATDQESKELMDKIQELLQELDKDDAIQMLEQFQMKNEMKQNEMKRMLELFKQLEMEKEIKNQIKDIEKLAEEQEKLAEDLEKNKKSSEEAKKEQEALNKKMEEIMKKQEELEKDNKELTPPKDMGQDNKEKMEDAKKDMEDSKDKLDKSDKSGASKAQKNAAKKMKQQAKSMSDAMEGGGASQAGEDIKTIRQLLENLITVSLEQEELYKNLNVNMATTPLFPSLVRKQFKLQNDFKIIEDTLVALSNRNSDIEAFVMEKVTEIKYNFRESIEDLEDRRVPTGKEKQRRTMKNLNDLALMMNESLDKAQQGAGAPGSGSCSKPGGEGQGKTGGKVPLDKITEGQQGVSEELQKMKDKQGKGKEGEGKDGNSAKDFAQAAAKQAALRKALKELNDQKKEQGKGSKELDEIINNMDKIETDLVNKRLNAETLKRMKDIETRLLEAEKAERQQDEDEKRKSETAKDKRNELPVAIEEYLKKRQSEIDMYKTVSPAVRPYYKSLVDEYFKALRVPSK